MNSKMQQIYDFALRDLTENLLPWWMKYTVDEEKGGFLGEVDNDNVPYPDADKFIVLNARLVWTFSAAYRVLGKPEYRMMADRAYTYFRDHFFDFENDGAHRNVDAWGKPVDSSRLVYGNAFAIYGLSEYFRATGCREALTLARRIVDSLEKHAYDREYKGYFETFTADWKHTPWVRGMNRVPSDEKTMNTHLHLLEAYTNLLRCEYTPFMQNKVREMLYFMVNRIVDRDIQHFYYYQDREWKPTSRVISFGHDIEGSWLMTEAAEVLGEEEAIRAVRDTCVQMARACFEEGLRPDGAMLTEKDVISGEPSRNLSWWEQNETVIGLTNLWQLTNDEKYLDGALRCVDFIDRHFIDHEKGGWFAILNEDGTKVLNDRKCAGFICPYHNTRMSLEIIERWRKLANA